MLMVFNGVEALRYVDLFWSFISVYLTVLKCTLMTLTVYLVWLMRRKAPTCQTYERSADSFSYEVYFLLPCAILGAATADQFHLHDVAWSMSIWLESVAIVPQLALLQKAGEVENLTSDFVGTMGLYRAFYIVNWIYRYFAEGRIHLVAWTGGVIQVALYCDFFYYYAQNKWRGGKLVLPGGM